MITGVINSDNIPQVLRGISQRRQQGVLEVNFAEKRVDIFFMQGKVVDVQMSDRDHVLEVLETLQHGGCVPEEFVLEATTYEELQEQLKPAGVDEAVFKRVLKHCVLDRLYRLDFHSGAYYNFKAQMVEGSRSVLPAISVGQLLLDLVSLESERSSFESIFPPHARLTRAMPAASFVSDEEAVVFEKVGDGGSVADVAERTMLSRFHFQEALLALHERGVIRVTGNTGERAAVDVNFDVSGIVEALEQSAREDILTGFNLERSGDRPVEAADEEAEPGGYSELRMQLGFLSARLLQESAVPHVLVYVFLAAALLMPVLYWGGIFARFGF